MAADRSSDKPKKSNRYGLILAHIFEKHFRPGTTAFEFPREEIESAAAELAIKLPKNIGDLLYSFRFRVKLPANVLATAPEGFEWSIEGAGRAKYRFVLRKFVRIVPGPCRKIKIPDATPEIVTAYALSDEQALLAKVRYNRLIDIFLRVAAYSIQNHLRTTVKSIGQLEVDEIYVGVDNHGREFVIPVQAKGGTDQIGITQLLQDIAFCKEKFPALATRAVAVQFVDEGDHQTIVMFELDVSGEDIVRVDEKHYRLVPASQITKDDLDGYERDGRRHASET